MCIIYDKPDSILGICTFVRFTSLKKKKWKQINTVIVSNDQSLYTFFPIHIGVLWYPGSWIYKMLTKISWNHLWIHSIHLKVIFFNFYFYFFYKYSGLPTLIICWDTCTYVCNVYQTCFSNVYQDKNYSYHTGLNWL